MRITIDGWWLIIICGMVALFFKVALPIMQGV
jgi:hypothetical protein